MNYLLTLTAAPTATTTDRALLLGQLAAGVREAAVLGTLHAVSEPASVRVEDASELYVLSLYDGYDLSETLLGVVTGDGLHAATVQALDHIIQDLHGPTSLGELYGPLVEAAQVGDLKAFEALMYDHCGGDNDKYTALRVQAVTPGALTLPLGERVQWLMKQGWAPVPGSLHRQFTHPEWAPQPLHRDEAFALPSMQARLEHERAAAREAIRANRPA